MILKQFYLGCLAHASYFIADETTKVAAVVDPQRDVDQYLEIAAASGCRIDHVLLTHFHADFVAGHVELAAKTGATIHLGAAGAAEYDVHAVRQGHSITFGNVRLEILETPGHTPESISIVIYDLAKSSVTPHAVCTGDTLFIGDVGRPDLLASVGWKASDLAGMLYDSLHQKLMKLPDNTIVYPAHGAGSFCGKSMSSETSSTIGQQRQFNYALQPMSREAFIAQVTAGQPEMPAYFAHDAALNRKRRATLDSVLATAQRKLSLDEVLELRDAGALILDSREPVDFDPCHLAGSTNVGLSGKYCTWVGTLFDKSRPIVLITDPGKERESAMRLGRIGFDTVVGVLDGGISAVQKRPDLLRRTERVEPAALATALSTPTAPFVLDVRNSAEVQEKRIAGATWIPLSHLWERAGEVPRGRRIVVHCAGGYRSAIAASLLEQKGFDGLGDLVGGMAGWEKANLAVVK